MAKLILIRHGECIWHSKNDFTGWMDVPLSADGIIDAIKAGSRISRIKFNIVVTSMQIRAVEAAMIALTQNENDKMPILVRENKTIEEWITTNNKVMEKGVIPVFQNQALNIQCELQYCNSIKIRDTEDEYIVPWCASYDKPLQNDACMNDTAKRTIPFFRDTIIPLLRKGRNVMLSAHNNSLRPVVMYIDESEKASVVEIPTGKPLCYEYIEGKLKKIPL